jgi:hypothetical protein
MSTTDSSASLPRRWFTAGTNLEVWGEAGTYKEIPYEALPPLPVVVGEEGSFAWLRGAPVSPHALDFGDFGGGGEEGEAGEADEESKQAAIDARLARIVFDATKLGLTVPAALVAFIGHPELHRRVPSCTACYLDVPAKLVPLPGGQPGMLLRFMNDQQCCLLWYVLLEPGGGHSVVCAAPDYEDDAIGESIEDIAKPRDVAVCAPSFEAFMHRFWLENSLWFAVNKRVPLTAEQKAYADAAKRARESTSN